MAKKKEKNIYGEYLYDYKPTVGSLLREYLQERLSNVRRVKESPIQPGAIFRPQEDVLKNLPLQYIAVVKDSVVEEMIRVNVKTAEVLLSENVQLVAFNPQEVVVQLGMICKDGEFLFQADIPKENSDFINSDTTFEEEIANEKD
jgi:hypothetical protein